MVPNEALRKSANMVRTTDALSMLIALWFFISPWVFRAYAVGNAWNAWIVGGVMAIAALIGMNLDVHSAANLSWLSIVLSVWVFFSPWIYGYSGSTGRFVDSLCVGVAMFILSIITASMGSRVHTSPVAHPM